MFMVISILQYFALSLSKSFLSVASQLASALMKRRLSVTNFSLENNLPTFRLNAPVIIRAKVKRCEQMLLFIAVYPHSAWL